MWSDGVSSRPSTQQRNSPLTIKVFTRFDPHDKWIFSSFDHFRSLIDTMSCCLSVKLFVIGVFIVVLACGQDVPISEPKLISIDPVNSTALTVTWQFANFTFDQSDRVQISIRFIEFLYNYNATYPPINFTFGLTNKTLTSLTKNFPLVNAFYQVCFVSNSSRSNSSRAVSSDRCFFKRTCSRLNASLCPSASLIVFSSSSISSNSFLVTVHWLKNLPYLRQSTTIQLLDSTINGTPSGSIDNDTYTSFPYRFSDLQSSSVYTVNLTVSYLLFDRSFSETQLFSVTTSRSTNVFAAGEGFFGLILCCHFVLLFVFEGRLSWAACKRKILRIDLQSQPIKRLAEWLLYWCIEQHR